MIINKTSKYPDHRLKRRLYLAGRHINTALMLGLCSVWLYDHAQNTHVDMAVYAVDKDVAAYARAVDADIKKFMRGE